MADNITVSITETTKGPDGEELVLRAETVDVTGYWTEKRDAIHARWIQKATRRRTTRGKAPVQSALPDDFLPTGSGRWTQLVE